MRHPSLMPLWNRGQIGDRGPRHHDKSSSPAQPLTRSLVHHHLLQTRQTDYWRYVCIQMAQTLLETQTVSVISNSDLQKSITALSSSLYSNQNSSISKIYKRASTLFLTRQLKEAHSLLTSLIDGAADASSNGFTTNIALIDATRNQRVKIWCLYLSLIDELLKVGPVQGATFVGLKNWSSLKESVTDSTVWDYVTKQGYQGRQASVDEEVIASLVALLLMHAPNQKETQDRLESFLITAPQPEQYAPVTLPPNPSAPPSQDLRGRKRKLADRETPRELAIRIKLLELYILHVLPRNDQYDYARDFTQLQPLLDAERKAGYLRILTAIQEDRSADRIRRRALRRQRRDGRPRLQGLAGDGDGGSDTASDSTERPRQVQVEVEGGRAGEEEVQRPSTADSSRSDAVPLRDLDPCPTGYVSEAEPARPPLRAPQQTFPMGPGGGGTARSPSRRAKRAGPVSAGILGLVARLQLGWANLYEHLVYMTQVGLGSRSLVARLVVVIVALVFVFGNARVRERLRRILQRSWERLVATLRMGTTISYF